MAIPNIVTENFNTWFTKTTNLTYDEQTKLKYLRIIKSFFTYLNTHSITRLNDINSKVLTIFLTRKPNHSCYASSSIFVRQAALTIFFSWAYSQHLCRENPLLSYRKENLKLKKYEFGESPKNDFSPSSILSDSEQQKLLCALATTSTFLDVRASAIVSLILATGLQIYEVCELEVENFHLNKGILLITKGKRQRYVAIEKTICEDFCRKWLSIRQNKINKENSYLFLSSQLRSIKINNLRRDVLRAFKIAKIIKKPIGADCLRQTAISRWVKLNISPEKMIQQFGFKQLSTLKRYLDKINT